LSKKGIPFIPPILRIVEMSGAYDGARKHRQDGLLGGQLAPPVALYLPFRRNITFSGGMKGIPILSKMWVMGMSLLKRFPGHTGLAPVCKSGFMRASYERGSCLAIDRWRKYFHKNRKTPFARLQATLRKCIGDPRFEANATLPQCGKAIMARQFLFGVANYR
jgi:hypothetical protein